jgi:hypothetical protein
MPRKRFFFQLNIVGTIKSVFKENYSLRSHKTVEIKVFLKILLVDGKMRTGSGSVQIIKNQDPGGPKTYGSGTLGDV